MPDELKSFKKITSEVCDVTKKNCLIMGKNTWYSLPKRPLINRINIIISLNDYDNIKKELEDDYINTNTKDKPIIFKNLEEAFNYVNDTDIIESAFIIGGAILYNDCLEKYVDKIKYIYMSIIYDKKYECNKFIAANIIFNNFKFEKKHVTNYSAKYISMKGYNKGISYPKDEPVD
jgi:dihydrofolate reductase